MGITIFKIFIWGGISSDIRSEITFYGSAYASPLNLLSNRIYRGSYMSAHVLLNLLNESGKRDKIFFRYEFKKFNNTRARMLDSNYYMT